MGNFNTQNITQESGEPTGENATFDLGAGMVLDLELPKLEDVDHPLVPEQNQEYLMREINGVQDLKLLSFVVDDPDFYAMLEGEAGVGKNMAIETLLATANWPRVRVNFGIGTTYQNLVGRYAPVDSEDSEDETIERAEAIRRTAQRMFEQSETMDMDKAMEVASLSMPQGSSFEWIDGLLTRCVKNGWAFIADEINTGEPEALSPLNGITEDRNSRYLTIEERSEVIEPHPRFRFIATRNPQTYAGVGEMNDALESRAYVIKFGQHDKEATKEIIKNRTDIVENESEAALDQLLNFVIDNLRTQEQSGNEIMTKVSTRDLIKIGRLTDITNLENAVTTVLEGISDPSDEDSIKEEINDIKWS